MNKAWTRAGTVLLIGLLAACGSSSGASAGTGSDTDTGGSIADAAADVGADTGQAQDASAPKDAGSGGNKDMASIDSSSPTDAGIAVDAPGPVDTSAPVDAGGGPDPAEWSACDNNNDCTNVEVGCCDHCNGGKLMGFNKKFADVGKAKHKETPCTKVACTEKGCANALAWCDNGVCNHKPDPAFPWGCAKLNESNCTLSPKCLPITAWAKGSTCGNKPGTKVFKGCMNSSQSCTTAEICARNLETAETLVFPSGCLPEGWQTQPDEICCPEQSDTCKQGAAATMGKICVRGPGGTTDIKAGQPVQITVWPKGCMSSSCTKIHSSGCTVSGKDGGLDVSGLICLEGKGGGICTADCNGGGFAKCDSGNVAKGSWTAKMGGLSVSFTVPSTVPASGVCAGSQF